MDESEFPPNSSKSKQGKPEDKKVTQVVSGRVKRKKRSLRKQFTETFVAGDAKGALRYVVMDVLLPAVKDMVVEAGSQGIEKLIFGDARRSRRGAPQPPGGPTGHISYNRYSMGSASRYAQSSDRAMSRAARSRHNFDEIILDQRTEAEDVVDKMFEIVSQFEQASVADLYELVGLQATHTDHKWGWADLTGAGVTRIRGGYLLDLPEPEPLD